MVKCCNVRTLQHLINPGLKVRNWPCHWVVGDRLTQCLAHFQDRVMIQGLCRFWSQASLRFHLVPSVFPHSKWCGDFCHLWLIRLVEYRKGLMMFSMQFAFSSCLNTEKKVFPSISRCCIPKDINDFRPVQERLLKAPEKYVKGT